ncbi:alpha/beta hydrolase [Dyella acidiphila]|uniref:Alpha/beta fold hydrolase n=1 Tax=Dyella acidiphila TaxID=2775866 RepID=A0ABR9GF70_9GAMM|nr:alpha/beta fold hydrolase [Dyella acidiphila]MBE1162680.1 alpha/beta fold hydrolase [Dyella acidiphila]
MLASLAMTLALAAPAAYPPIDTIALPLPQAPAEHLALHCVHPAQPPRAAVLFVHGASFPTLLAAGFQFSPGDSWLHDAARHGYLACGLDFLGFGGSSRPPAMLGPAKQAAPVAEAREAAVEIALAAAYLRNTQGMQHIHVVAHSWGTVPAALFAAQHPAALTSLTLFGPIVPVKTAAGDDSAHSAWWSITAQQRLEQLRFKDELPRNTYLLEPAVDRNWAAAFAASVPHVPGDKDDALRIPSGPLADIDTVAAGSYPYRASDVQVPVFVVYGNYDTVVDDQGATHFLAGFTHSPLRWRLRIDNGTHVLHLERNRGSLYASVDAFIHAVEAQSP